MTGANSEPTTVEVLNDVLTSRFALRSEYTGASNTTTTPDLLIDGIEEDI